MTRTSAAGSTSGRRIGRPLGWPTPADREEGTPRYLLDTYPSTLTQDPRRLAELASDIGWVEAAIASVGVDRRPGRPAPGRRREPGKQQRHGGPGGRHRPGVTTCARPQPVDQPGYILRQLWMQAAELAEDEPR